MEIATKLQALQHWWKEKCQLIKIYFELKQQNKKLDKLTDSKTQEVFHIFQKLITKNTHLHHEDAGGRTDIPPETKPRS